MTFSIPTCPTCGLPNWPKDLVEISPVRDGRELRARLLSIARGLANQPESTFAVGGVPTGFVRTEDVGHLALQLARLANQAEVLATEPFR